MFDTSIDDNAIDAIVHARHGDPFAVLGPHEALGGTIVRAFIPDADTVHVLARDTGLTMGELHRRHEAGFWCGKITSGSPYFFRVASAGRMYDIEDAYSFPPILGDIDTYLLGEGRHRDFANVLGAHVTNIDGVRGVRFAVWAPNARRVSVVGSFNQWDGRRHPMRLRQGAGVWELFIPRLAAGDIYKFEILGPDGQVLPLKADPVAQATEKPPATGSIVAEPASYEWTDTKWFDERARRQSLSAPISIYEVHAMSWLPNAQDGGFGWDELGDKLIPYVQAMGFTHIELMPIMEHPFGGSWGYQPLAQFAPTARLGAPAGFARFVDRCHAAELGVILDWVPAHFPTDAHGLARFDGTALYEHADPKEGFHRDWNTLIYNHGRNEVRGFLIGSALYWLEQFHVDGIRVDAVASMLYRDYSRPAGEWVPNKFGGRENLEAIEFFHELSRAMTDRASGCVLIAEEFYRVPRCLTSYIGRWPRVRLQVEHGLDARQPTLHGGDSINRRWHHGKITFGLVYAFSEHFVLPLSHDEVVYGKGSLIQKMTGDRWQKFAALRAYLAFMWTHPGRKLLFMGGEFAQWHEWNHDVGLDWSQLDEHDHKGVQTAVRDLNQLYRAEGALHARDSEVECFRWIIIDDADQSIFAYLRLGGEGHRPILVVCNFSPVPRYGYRIGVPAAGAWLELLNTDAACYGGGDVGNSGGVQASPVGSNAQPYSVGTDVASTSLIDFRCGVNNEIVQSGPLLHGPTFLGSGRVQFSIWAPDVDRVTLQLLHTEPLPLSSIGGGWHQVEALASTGDTYSFLLPDGRKIPDPASRLQADDVHSDSVLVDPTTFSRKEDNWINRPWHEAVVYELHVGLAGGFKAAQSRLKQLASIGFTAVQLMPIADFPGKRNWGYDGVLPFAPDRAYGTPEELRTFIDVAHAEGLMVFLDVVYNHFGPDGAYLHVYAKSFFDNTVHTPWGAAINFEEPAVYSFFLQNALMWLNDYGFDGLRFDAVHQISPASVLPRLANDIRANARHPVHLILENENNAASLLLGPTAKLFDAQWADDWHHCVHVLLTGENEGYYSDFQSASEKLATCMSEGFVYQGQASPHQGKPRGEPSAGLPTTAFVTCLQNHDQIGNRALGERLTNLADAESLRAAVALLLLSPNIPMTFMGEETGSQAPFLFFTDHEAGLADLVREGRRKEFAHFAAFQDEKQRAQIPDPNAEATFLMSRDLPDPAASSSWIAFYTQLLELRRSYVIPGLEECCSLGAEALGAEAVAGSWRLGNGTVLYIATNFADTPQHHTPPSDTPILCSSPISQLDVLPPRATVVFLSNLDA